MKRILVFVITVIMILSMATSVMAATVYLDTGVNGKAAMDTQWDSANVFQFGFKVPVDQWFVGLDYSTLTVKDGLDSRIWNYDIKGGYSFVNNNAARVTATVGYYHQDFDNDYLVSAVTLGLDSQFKIAEDLYLEAEVDCALAGKDYQHNGVTGTLNSASDYKVKLNYFLTRNFGVSLGYYYNEYKPEVEPMMSHNALTLGITGKF